MVYSQKSKVNNYHPDLKLLSPNIHTAKLQKIIE